MRQSFTLIRKDQPDIPGVRLLFQQLQTQARAINRSRILSPLQGVPRPFVDKAPFLSDMRGGPYCENLGTTESQQNTPVKPPHLIQNRGIVG